jgi:hypothetical protein
MVGSNTYNINPSPYSSQAALTAINNMYNNGGGFVLISQDAQFRRFRATVTAICSQGGAQQTYQPVGNLACANGATLNVSAIVR